MICFFLLLECGTIIAYSVGNFFFIVTGTKKKLTVCVGTQLKLLQSF